MTKSILEQIEGMKKSVSNVGCNDCRRELIEDGHMCPTHVGNGWYNQALEDIKPLIQEWEKKQKTQDVRLSDDFWEFYADTQHYFLQIAEGKKPLDSWNDQMLSQGKKLEAFISNIQGQDRLEKAIEECGDITFALYYNRELKKWTAGDMIDGEGDDWRMFTEGATPLLAVENLKKALNK